MNVVWSNRAAFKYEQVLSYLLEKWTVKEAQRLVRHTNTTIKKIQKNPSLYKMSTQYNYLRKTIVTKHNSIIYQVEENEIIIIDYLDNRANNIY